ncbi:MULTISPECIES: TetR/AcrR family transcriptional regulator [Agathobacter]|uniref:TetR/AcrR family transcriptional regulator n=1 Tax=Agathobacter ruminis TaxID=1712665 RepID=A0A2G3E0N0_9FIRM|nr:MULTISPECIES: TetR/AcrR family transcriptional regulator [Agathobacter]MBQ1681490.1 TetR/AcrR family transcriptional regulator [Agathobacter sp.]MDC7301341.1 TetR/AcrR family transcriptional regulator [Agathobacter ruminis]PHU36781.1 TetR/AcrR family transcriptional regulator [Agathobacter ruminis]
MGEFINYKITTSDAILEKAFVIARREGIDALTIRKLATECGIAVGSVYNYFANKEAVVAACRSLFWGEILKDQEKLVRPGMGFTDFLTQYYSFMAIRLAQDDNSWLRVMDQSTMHSVQKLFSEVLANDSRINGSIWNLELTPDNFVEHVRANLLALLQAGERDCRFYIFLLEHLLYER